MRATYRHLILLSLSENSIWFNHISSNIHFTADRDLTMTLCCSRKVFLLLFLFTSLIPLFVVINTPIECKSRERFTHSLSLALSHTWLLHAAYHWALTMTQVITSCYSGESDRTLEKYLTSILHCVFRNKTIRITNIVYWFLLSWVEWGLKII